MAIGGDPHHLDSSGEPPEKNKILNAVSDASKHKEDMLRRYGQASTDPAREPPPPVRPEPSPGTRGPGPPASPASPAPLAARQPMGRPDPALKHPPLRFHHPPGGRSGRGRGRPPRPRHRPVPWPLYRSERESPSLCHYRDALRCVSCAHPRHPDEVPASLDSGWTLMPTVSAQIVHLSWHS